MTNFDKNTKFLDTDTSVKLEAIGILDINVKASQKYLSIKGTENFNGKAAVKQGF